VVVGLGYVGLPLVLEAVAAGLSVRGLDRSQTVVRALNEGRSHIDDVSDDVLGKAVAQGFSATDDASIFTEAHTVVICVPTPLSADGGPDLSAIISVAEQLGPLLQPGTLVVLESTTWPGTTEEVLQPILEAHGLRAGEDYFLAFSPERIDPGNAKYGLRNTPKVVGGATPACSSRATSFYEQVVDEVVVAAGTREAEMAKLLENTYRHINIALVNEMAKFSHELGIDLWDVIRCAATKPFGFQAFFPGPGVGGHCIPIDPNYLSHRVRAQLGYPFRFVELAQEINLSMPQYVARRVQEALNDQSKSVRGARVLLLGVTYKENIADQRESPARPLAQRLLSMGAKVEYHDPHVPEWKVGAHDVPAAADLHGGLRNCDLAVLLQGHDAYADIAAVAQCAILDTKGKLSGDTVVRL
jgi:UDP-N-acetyl-D-glucosamine dehydrogenase